VHILWRIHLARFFLRHHHMEACLAEVGRNPALRRVLGLEEGQPVPDDFNMSRFLKVLGQPQHLALLGGIFEELIRRLAEAVPDLGRHVAGDSAALCARGGAQEDHGNARNNPAKDAAHQGQHESGQSHLDQPLPQPAGGRKQYQDNTGKLTAVYEWFGYKFHLLVDVKHELVLAFQITAAAGEGTGDSSVLPLILKKAQALLPAERIQTLAYDKAADNQKTHELLHQAGIKPLIEIRELWKDEQQRQLPGQKGLSNVVHDEAGTPFCYDTVSKVPVKHKMAYIGYEKQRGTLKYRCPARHEGWECPSDKKCNGCSAYGMTRRLNCRDDLRRFPPIPRATAEFERRYNGRTAVERVNGRSKIFWGADDGNVTGAERFHALLTTIMVVQAAIATWLVVQPRYEGKSLSPTRLSQIARHLARASGP
jgi:hypothetical protein